MQKQAHLSSRVKNDVGIANAMRLGAKEKATKLCMKMIKLLRVANPSHGPKIFWKR
jgi:hypothetical protein